MKDALLTLGWIVVGVLFVWDRMARPDVWPLHAKCGGLVLPAQNEDVDICTRCGERWRPFA